MLIVILPLMGLGFLLNEQLETLALMGAVLLALWTLISGCKHHRKKSQLVTFLLGVILIFLSRLLDYNESTFAVLGACCIALAHLQNQYFFRNVCRDCSQERIPQ